MSLQTTITSKGGSSSVASPVDAGRRQREVQEVGGELLPGCRTGGTQAGVVGLGEGDYVLDVRFLDVVEPGPGIGAVDAALGLDDAGFD